jgi:hypothetical protein
MEKLLLEIEKMDVNGACCGVLVDRLADLKAAKETSTKSLDGHINTIETELLSRGLRQLEDKSVKYTTFKGERASATVGMARTLKVHNVENLKKIVTDRWHGEIKTKDPDHSVSADFSRALASLYLEDYISEMSLADLLMKGVTVQNSGGDGTEASDTDGRAQQVYFSKQDTSLLLKKLKGDYEKDKKLFEGVLGFELQDELDTELYFISKIRNWERIRKYFSTEEAMGIKMQIKAGVFVSETIRLTMRS